ncbi:MAG: hypothetical protein ACFNP5_06800 [Hoylesella saccharolytica]
MNKAKYIQLSSQTLNEMELDNIFGGGFDVGAPDTNNCHFSICNSGKCSRDKSM